MGCGLNKNNGIKGAIGNPSNLNPEKEAENNLVMKPTYIMGKSIRKVEDDYTILSKIGSGSFGSVYKVIHEPTKLIRAMKVIIKASMRITDENYNDKLLKEIQVLLKVDHPNIIKMYNYYEDERNYYIIMEYIDGGPLDSAVREWEDFDEYRIAYIMHQIASALTYLHSSGIIHRDIKPSNILIEKITEEKKYNIKLIDFSGSNFFKNEEIFNMAFGTPNYIAPEILRGYGYDYKSDIWSLGAMLYFLIMRYPPFNAKTEHEILENVKNGNYIVYQGTSKLCKELLRSMLVKLPLKRISLWEFFFSTWTKQVNLEFTNNDLNYRGKMFDQLMNSNKHSNENKFQLAILLYIVRFYIDNKYTENVRNFFSYLTNHNGTVSYESFKCSFTSTYGEDAFPENEIENLFKKIDLNKNSRIEYEEFLCFALDRKSIFTEQNLENVFKECNLNNDGILSKSEINILLGTNDSIHYDMIKYLDHQNDSISFEDFKKIMLLLVDSSKESKPITKNNVIINKDIKEESTNLQLKENQIFEN